MSASRDFQESAKLKEVRGSPGYGYDPYWVPEVTEGESGVLDAWALRVGGLLWVLDAEVTGWPLCAVDEERAWEMVAEGTRRLVGMGELGVGEG